MFSPPSLSPSSIQSQVKQTLVLAYLIWLQEEGQPSDDQIWVVGSLLPYHRLHNYLFKNN